MRTLSRILPNCHPLFLAQKFAQIYHDQVKIDCLHLCIAKLLGSIWSFKLARKATLEILHKNCGG